MFVIFTKNMPYLNQKLEEGREDSMELCELNIPCMVLRNHSKTRKWLKFE